MGASVASHGWVFFWGASLTWAGVTCLEWTTFFYRSFVLKIGYMLKVEVPHPKSTTLFVALLMRVVILLLDLGEMEGTKFETNLVN